MKATGLYRIKDGWTAQNSAVVDYGRNRQEVPEDQYRLQNYRPPFDDLPWKEAYKERNA